MQNDVGLKWERYIFDLVYDAASFDLVVHTDAPDFKVTRRGSIRGVEITELFKDSSSARLVKVPEYMQKMLDGERALHKDDLTGINVVAFEVSDAEGNVVQEQVKGIFSEIGSMLTHADALAELIEQKNEKFYRYDQDLENITLVIGDHFSEEESIADQYSTADFFTPRLRQAIQATPFREVILITNFLYDNAGWVPLRQLELLESFMVFVHCVYQNQAAIDLLDVEDLVHLFAGEMEGVGRPVSIRTEGGREFASRGHASVAYTVDEGIIMHDHSDHSDKAPADMVAPRDVSLPSEIFTSIGDNFKQACADGAGVELSYHRQVREAKWPFDFPAGSQNLRLEPLDN